MKKRARKCVNAAVDVVIFIVALPILAAELAWALVFASREILRQLPPSKRR